jgi:decaprenylphospho-beta-D-erythro-pentofuranosid-2-ulose 2-reductase
MTALILGANSDIAVALARHLASAGYDLQLAARDIDKLNVLKADIEIRNKVSVTSVQFDALDFKSHYSFYHSLSFKPDVAILVFGYLGEHARAIEDWSEAERILNTNYVGAVSILNIISNDFAKRKKGIIIGISSVAGDRGRMSNYIYGSSKAGLTAYLSGLRNRLFHSGVHVMTVNPGFMQTKMTEGLKLSASVTAKPVKVAEKIFSAMQKKRNSIYVLPVWFLIMLMIRNIPEFVFKKMKL